VRNAADGACGRPADPLNGGQFVLRSGKHGRGAAQSSQQRLGTLAADTGEALKHEDLPLAQALRAVARACGGSCGTPSRYPSYGGTKAPTLRTMNSSPGAAPVSR
jgi:hypothetical protein